MGGLNIEEWRGKRGIDRIEGRKQELWRWGVCGGVLELSALVLLGSDSVWNRLNGYGANRPRLNSRGRKANPLLRRWLIDQGSSSDCRRGRTAKEGVDFEASRLICIQKMSSVVSLNSLLESSQIVCLNESASHSLQSLLKNEGGGKYTESDSDAQLILTLPVRPLLLVVDANDNR